MNNDATRKARVLVVDDEQLNRVLLRRVLGSDYQIQEAADAFEATRLLDADGPVDVLICDQMMPGKSGTDLARETQERWPNTVTVLLTGYSDSSEVSVAVHEGVLFEVVGKPMLVRDFKDVIARASAEHERRSGS